MGPCSLYAWSLALLTLCPASALFHFNMCVLYTTPPLSRYAHYFTVLLCLGVTIYPIVLPCLGVYHPFIVLFCLGVPIHVHVHVCATVFRCYHPVITALSFHLIAPRGPHVIPLKPQPPSAAYAWFSVYQSTHRTASISSAH